MTKYPEWFEVLSASEQKAVLKAARKNTSKKSSSEVDRSTWISVGGALIAAAIVAAGAVGSKYVGDDSPAPRTPTVQECILEYDAIYGRIDKDLNYAVPAIDGDMCNSDDAARLYKESKQQQQRRQLPPGQSNP